jgi:hypothetical protein
MAEDLQRYVNRFAISARRAGDAILDFIMGDSGLAIAGTSNAN